MVQKMQEAKSRVIDAGRAESPRDPVAADVLEEFEEAQKRAGSGPQQLERKLKAYTDRGPELSGGDIDAEWDRADIGEECVSGENPTPDQSVVEDLGEAVGETQEDEKPLRTANERHQTRHPVDLLISREYPYPAMNRERTSHRNNTKSAKGRKVRQTGSQD